MTVRAMVDWGRRRTIAAGKVIGARRTLLAIGFAGIAMGAAACSDGGVVPPQTSCAPAAGSVTFPAAGQMLPNGTTVGSGTTATTLTVRSSQCASVVGQEVTFTATLGWPAGTAMPTGDISVGVGDGQNQTAFDGCATLAVSPTSGTSATFTCSHTFAAVSSQTIVEATYNGDATFGPSGAGFVQQVNKASTTTTLSSSSPNPSVFGQDVTFTAAVSANTPGTGTPTGTVAFSDNGSPLSCTGGSQTLDSGGGVTCTTSALPAGARSITAVYQGDANDETSTTAAGLSQTVSPGSTTTTVSSSANPSVVGQPATFTATVAPVAPAGGTPSGTAVFTVDGVAQPAVTLSGGQATFAPSTLAVGSHSVSVSYASSDANFADGSGSLTGGQAVDQASTTTTVASSAPSTTFGQAVTFTATVAPLAPGAGNPSGTAVFTVDGVAQPAVTLSGGQASSTITTLSGGDHSVTAAYSGDADFTASTTAAALSQTVTPAPTVTTVSSSPAGTVSGQTVSFTATVAPSDGRGSVGFFADGSATPLTGCDARSLSLVDGTYQATCDTSALGAGTHPITATYAGDTDYATSASTGFSQTVAQATTTTTAASSAQPSVFGQPVTVTATVAPAAPGGGTPTGAVTFTVDGTARSPVPLTAGHAGLSVMNLSVGMHSIAATYQGDADFITSSTASALAQTVNQASASTALSSSDNPSAFGRALTFTAAVTVQAPGAGTPTGAVDFSDNGQPLGAAAVAQSGRATLTTSSLPAGDHTISAAYRGDTHLKASSASLRQTVGCTVISGNHTGAVAVTQATCVQGATLSGGVTISAGGSLLVDHSQIGGSIVSDRATAVRICSSTLNGDVSLTRTSGFALLGAGATPCGGDTFKGAVKVVSSSGPVELGGDTVMGAVTVSGNTGSAAELEGNHVRGALVCTGNAPAPTDGGQPNVAGARLGQCSSPTF